MKLSHAKTLVIGIITGAAMNVSGLVTFGLLGVGKNTDKILVGANGPQNDKIVAVWNTLEPLPLSVTDPWIIGLFYFVFGILLAYTYREFLPGWHKYSRKKRGWYMTWILLLMFIFWEVSTPINLFSEPLPLVAIDMLFWIIMAYATGYALVYSADLFTKHHT